MLLHGLQSSIEHFNFHALQPVALSVLTLLAAAVRLLRKSELTLQPFL